MFNITQPIYLQLCLNIVTIHWQECLDLLMPSSEYVPPICEISLIKIQNSQYVDSKNIGIIKKISIRWESNCVYKARAQPLIMTRCSSLVFNALHTKDFLKLLRQHYGWMQFVGFKM